MNLGILFGSGALLGLAIIAVALFRDLGYKSGVKDGYTNGYAVGRTDADNWWIRTESEVDQARVKIWREEAQR